MEIVYIAVGLLTGFFVAYLVVSLKLKSSENKLLETRNEYGKIQAQLEERVNNLQTENARLLNQLDEVELVKDQQMQQLAKAEAEFENLREKLVTQKLEMEDLQKKLTTEFENIANKILDKNSEKFTATNQKNMGDVLNPLKEKIELFERKVEDTYKQGLKDQTDLRAELKKLFDLNSKISEEANNLTRALKGDVKKQGNWGEVVLERILERSGLNEGTQGYEKQFNDTAEDGRRIQPDIVINLPDNKHIIVGAAEKLRPRILI
jgi:DNA recombination protein RmuC